MFDGLLSWISQIAAIWGFTVALGAPMPIAQATTPPPVNSSVLGAATITPPPLQQPQPAPLTPPVVVEPDPVKPVPVDPPVVKPVKPPVYCLHKADDGTINAQIRRCGCNYTPDPKPTSSSPNVYLCRYPLDENSGQ